MNFIYIGDPRDNNDQTKGGTVDGVYFARGESTPASEAIAAKLKNHSHFKICTEEADAVELAEKLAEAAELQRIKDEESALELERIAAEEEAEKAAKALEEAVKAEKEAEAALAAEIEAKAKAEAAPQAKAAQKPASKKKADK